MDDSLRKNYNREYYLKNREKLLSRARNRTKKGRGQAKVLSLFGQMPSEPCPGGFHRDRVTRTPFLWKLRLLWALVLAMTFYLLLESTRFYYSAEGHWLESLLKALILEGAAVAFSLAKARTWLGTLTYKGLVAAIYIYSVLLISGTAFNQAGHQEKEVQITEKRIQGWEESIAKLEITRDRFWKDDRVTLARKYDIEIASLKNKLDQTRKDMIQLPTSKIVWNTLWMLVGFRILVMLSNFCCLQILKSGKPQLASPE